MVRHSTELSRLYALIERVLGERVPDSFERDRLRQLLRADAETAIERYHRGESEENGIRLDTYFTWYIAERLNTPGPR